MNQKLLNTLRAENSYMRAYRDAGLSDPSVINNKFKLDRAIRGFEAATGIKWPIK